MNDKLSLLNELTDCTIAYRLTLVSIINLLKILRVVWYSYQKIREHFLKTPSPIDIIEMRIAKFWYNRIKFNLLSALSICDIPQPYVYLFIIFIKEFERLCFFSWYIINIKWHQFKINLTKITIFEFRSWILIEIIY